MVVQGMRRAKENQFMINQILVSGQPNEEEGKDMPHRHRTELDAHPKMVWIGKAAVATTATYKTWAMECTHKQAQKYVLQTFQRTKTEITHKQGFAVRLCWLARMGKSGWGERQG